MPQRAIELILVRQLASRLSVPVFVIDDAGDLLYFNEPAEVLLGRRFDDSPPTAFADWTTAFTPRDRSGARVPPTDLPLVRTLHSRRPEHGDLQIEGLDGTTRVIEITAFPLEGAGGRYLGAVAMFWET